ncbi:hypothetical protein M3Y99_01606100 [Aphelenchoides fujianensis]|nr:hypothetical protein M3Y99_01606100 [Aphelenchoides fujianensis]
MPSKSKSKAAKSRERMDIIEEETPPASNSFTHDSSSFTSRGQLKIAELSAALIAAGAESNEMNGSSPIKKVCHSAPPSVQYPTEGPKKVEMMQLGPKSDQLSTAEEDSSSSETPQPQKLEPAEERRDQTQVSRTDPNASITRLVLDRGRITRSTPVADMFKRYIQYDGGFKAEMTPSYEIRHERNANDPT